MSPSEFTQALPRRFTRQAAAVVACSLVGWVHAQTALPEYVVTGTRVSNQTSVGTLDMPVSALRYEPRVDVQARNLAEAQADIAIRGGHFENTGFRLGGAAVSDPQTGHYLAEVPIAPQMLTAPRVVTGLENAVSGFNAGAGTVSYGLRRIQSGGAVGVAAGAFGYNRQSVYAAETRAVGATTWAGDAEWARSESDGSVAGGDHDFSRVAARVQRQTAAAQTDFLVGYQHKFFGWPNLYTPFGFQETENLQTVLVLLNHRWSDADGNSLEASAFYRRNKDDYEFNRAVPGASNPFQHTTWVRGVALACRAALSRAAAVRFTADATSDDLQSTALTFGRFSSRELVKLAAVPEYTWSHSGGDFVGRAGVTYDRSNRDGSTVSPLAGLEWRTSASSVYAEYSEATQLASYTALNSNPSAGLFRGNANLGRTSSENAEIGVRRVVAGWQVEAALFRRTDDALVDWTFRRGVVARTANPVDIRTTGAELVVSRRTERYEVVAGYAWLEKRADYGSATIDASFYALNFPRHRFTLAATLRLGGGFELRSDNEYRVQEANPLRTIGGDRALLSSLGLYFTPPAAKAWEFSVLVDNLWDDDFQEVPAVPAARRQWAAGATWRW
jgi:hypothetical protein